MNRKVYGVILAGGSGTRFWPLSRERFPKQLLRIMGEETLIQQTVRRLLRFMTADRIMVVTNETQAESILLQLVEWKDALSANLIAEPKGRNTAPAIGLAALRLLRRDPDGVMIVLPADHVITQPAKFQQAVNLGAQLAAEGNLVTFGIKPSRPETGYGYIQPQRRSRVGSRGKLTGYRVARFVEKPHLSTAQRYVRSGNFFWNSGMFMWKASTLLDELQQQKPSLVKGLKRVESMMHEGAPKVDIARQYHRLESISIDHGVMEHSSRSAVIPVEFGWSDVGSWGSLEEVAPRTKSGNVLNGNIMDMGSTNSVLFADRRVVATIGLSDMVVVDTPDATLVCPKSRAQDVKKVVEELKKRDAPEHLEHVTVMRPWGAYTVLEEAPGYKVKRITVNPGKRLSLQLHHKRSEHWVVITGRARVTRGEDVYDLRAGQSTGIPVETPHRLENPGKAILEIIEVQNGQYLGEDDIVRFQDDFGRGDMK
ncbi:MAG: mannose-1-phosphate guanylyltransferase/mannose-6-phosphate isomerase [Nitrospirales bacterium]|nr:mannose-1-phosphate guanylyltransferase/mannose-6-phosphate isomerase [Nitrospira sp.]MDR4499919.1 mannose-1-phosphate guanylyltransferase/mannose-6-phosphate isomerase [Nitrospirales bacterium]